MTLGVSGLLWNRSLVMYDRETESLWSHILGEAMAGPLKGTRLRQIPSAITTWERWRMGHPETTVAILTRTANRYSSGFYKDGRFFLFGIADGEAAKSWRFTTLMEQPVIHDTWRDQAIVILFDRASATPRMFRRRLDDRLLSFRADRQDERDVFVDQQTGSAWNPVTGIAGAGPLQGRHLEPLPAIVSFVQAWERFHPTSGDP